MPPCECPTSQNALMFSLAELRDDEVDDVLQVLVVGLGPRSRRRVRRGDDQTVLVLVVHEREIVALPVPVRTGAVEAEDERDLLAWLQIARIVEEVGAAGLHLDHVALVDHHRRRALGVGAVEVGGGGAGGAFEAEGFFGGSESGQGKECDGKDEGSQASKLLHTAPLGADDERNRKGLLMCRRLYRYALYPRTTASSAASSPRSIAASASRLARSRPTVTTASDPAALAVGDQRVARLEAAAHLDRVPGLGVADVARASRRSARSRRTARRGTAAPRRACCAPRSGPGARRPPSARRGSAGPTAGRGSARRRRPRRRRARARSCSSTTTPRSIVEPGRFGERERGRTPTPMTTRSHGRRAPSSSVDGAVGDRRGLAPEVEAHAVLLVQSADERAELVAEDARERHRLGRDHVDLEAARAQRRRHLEADEARADHDRALRLSRRAR